MKIPIESQRHAGDGRAAANYSEAFRPTTMETPRLSLFRWLLAGAAAGLTAATLYAGIVGPANDNFASRILITGNTNTVTGSNVNATREAGETNHLGQPTGASVWWTWTAPDAGTVTVDTAGSSFDTTLAVYTGNSVSSLSLVEQNDDGAGLSTSQLTFQATAGTTYQIVVDGFGGSNGTVTLTVVLPVTPRPPVITGQPQNQVVIDTPPTNATFNVTLTGSQPFFFQWLHNGTNLPAATGSSFTVTNATVGDAGTYSVAISNALGFTVSSNAVLTVGTVAPNDAFANRINITGQTNSVAGINDTATSESADPSPAGRHGGRTVWWKWTAPFNGLVKIDTAGSTNSSGGPLDTLLGVYVGSTLGSLTAVAEDPDTADPGTVRFRAVQGTEYQILVDGSPGTNGVAAVGAIKLNVTQSPDNDFFVHRLSFPANAGGRSVWWSWVTTNSGLVTIDTAGSSFDTLLAVYTGTAVGSLTLVQQDHNSIGNGASRVRFQALAGTEYQVAIDGFLGTTQAFGNITLNISQSSTGNDNFADRIPLVGQTNFVAGSNVGSSKESGEPNHAGNIGGRSVWWSWLPIRVRSSSVPPTARSTPCSLFTLELAWPRSRVWPKAMTSVSLCRKAASAFPPLPARNTRSSWIASTTGPICHPAPSH
jgi:hypothetical protein